MKTTYLLDSEFEPPVEAYQKSLAQLSQAKSLSEKFSATAAKVEKAGVSAGPPPLAVRPDQAKEQFQRAAGAIPPLLQEVVKEAAMIQTLETEILSAEQKLATALKLENAKRVKLIVFSIVGLFVLFFIFLLILLSQISG